MNTYIYWKNQNCWHEVKILEIEASNISEADKKFENETGLNPQKTFYISCSIKVGHGDIEK